MFIHVLQLKYLHDCHIIKFNKDRAKFGDKQETH